MAFPTYESTTGTGFATSVTTHSVDLPATVDPGDLLVLIVCLGVFPSSTPSGWTEITRAENSPTSGVVYARVADGTEDGGTVDVVTDSSSVGAAQVIRVSGWQGTLDALAVSDEVTGGDDSPDPAALTPGWDDETLWVYTAVARNDNATMASPPTNYSNLVDTVGGGGANLGATVATATRTLDAASEDPGSAALSEPEAWIAWTLAIAPSGVTFEYPAVESVTETGFASNTTSHDVDLPATVDAGDLLLLAITFDDDQHPSAAPSGWTQLAQGARSPTRCTLYGRVADGTEDGGTVDVQTSTATTGSAQVYRITSWGGSLSEVEVSSIVTNAGGASTSIDQPALTPSWGAEDTLWIAFCFAGDDDATVTAPPAAYLDLAHTASGGGTNESAATGSAIRRRHVATEDPPGDFVWSEDEALLALTVAVAPASVGGTPSASRWTQAGLQVLVADEGDTRWTQAGLQVLVTPPVGPDRPTISASVEGPHAISVESSPYAHDEGTDLAGFQWQIATDASFTADLQTVTESFDAPSEAADPPGLVWSGIEAATEYFVRVRHQDAAGVWSGWSAPDSATTDAEVKPGMPTIDSAAVEATSVVLTSSGYDDSGQGRTHVQSHWQIDESGGDWSTPVNESEEDADNLTSISVPGLTQGTAYQARVRYRASDGTWSEWSAAKSFTTLSVPADRPAQPTLTLEELTQTTARISTTAYSDPDSEPHSHTQWFVSDHPTTPTFGFAWIQESTTSTSDLLERTFSGLQQGKLYHVAARHRAQDGDWSDWSAWLSITTVAHPLGGELLHVLGPWHGEVIRGTVGVSWTPPSETDAVFDLQFSEDAGVSFSEIVEGHASSPANWDVSSLSDGYKLMRIRARSEATEEVTDWMNRWVYVDNADALSEGEELWAWNSSEQDPEEDVSAKWTPMEDLQGGQEIWRYGTSGQLYNLSDGVTDFMRIGFDAAFEPKQVDIVADVMIGSLGGDFPWEWFPELLRAGVGASMSDSPDEGRGVQANIWSIPINPHGDCLTRASGPMHLAAAAVFDSDGFAELTESILDLATLHFYLTLDGCNKRPRYGMRMRLTTIQELGGGRRRMRMQVGIAGRGILPDPERGWQFETTFETRLTCGQVGCVVQAQTSSNSPFVAIGHFTAHAIEFGECAGPEGFTDPDPESCPPPIFDLTVFGGDDETPIWGSVDAEGEITDPSFSTHPSHARPYLKTWQEGSEHEADPIKGTSSIGAVRVSVLDKRTDPCDPASGLLTAAMSDPDGFNALIGRRAILRERLGDGTYQIVQHGVVGPVELRDSLVTYEFDVRSMREREREVRVFTTQAKTMSAWPYGPVEGYGCVDTFGSTPICLFSPAPAAEGTYTRLRTESDGLIVGYLTDDAHTIDDYFLELIEIGRPRFTVGDDGDTSTRRVITEAIVRWRPAGGDEEDWVELDDMQTVKFGGVLVQGLGFTQQEGLFLFESATFRIQLNATDEDLLPSPGQAVEWQVLPDTEPSEVFPLWYEGFAGDLLSRIYDGDFSDRDPNIRYAAAQVPEGPFLRMRITEAEDDLRKWVEEHIYQPSLWVPSLTEDGTIIPVSTRLPDASESLTTLTHAEVVGVPLWRQDGGSAVPIATVKIIREGRTPIGQPADGNRRAVPRDSVGDDDNPFTYEFTEVEITRLARSSALLTTKATTFEPDTLRTVSGESIDGDTFDVLLEGARRQALDIVSLLTTRYAFGPELITLRARDLAAVRAIRVGTWFLLETTHLPDLQNRTRGGTLLCLALRRQKDPGLAWDITALVGGPGASCTSGTPSQISLAVNDDLSVTVTVPHEAFGWSAGFSSGFGSDDTTVRVEYAISDTEPAADSGLWTLLGTRTAAVRDNLPDGLRTEPFPAGVTVWFRAQAQQGLCRPSAWTTAQSVEVGASTPALLKLWITIGADGTPVVHWAENPPTLGLRIEYGVIDAGVDNTFGSTVEVDAKEPSASGWSSGFSLGFTAVSADRSHVLSGVTVNPGQKIAVRATPFSGWTGSAVSGTAGESRTTWLVQKDELSPAGFSAGYSPGFGA